MFTKNRKKLIKSLHQKKYRDLNKLFIVEGAKMISELVLSDFEIDGLYTLEDSQERFPDAEVISNADMQSISALKNASGVLAVVKQPEFNLSLSELGNRVIVLDDLKDPGNLGTIIRSAEWFGIKDIIVSTESVELYNPKVVQSTMGSIFRIQVHRGELEPLMIKLKSLGYTTYGAHMQGHNIKSEDWSDKCALIIGSEAHGISSEISSVLDRLVSIEGSGSAESLNAAVAASIIMSHW